MTMKNKKAKQAKKINKNPKNKTFAESFMMGALQRAIGSAAADAIKPYVDSLIDAIKSIL